MDRKVASELAHSILKENGLSNWKVRISTELSNGNFLGLCDHSSKTIFLNQHILDIHPNAEIENTIKHECAHAVVGPGHGHDTTWSDMAKKLGCDSIGTCGMSLNPIAIDAIRSGHVLEMEVVENVTREVKYKVKKITELCPICQKPAIELSSYEFDNKKYINLKCNHLIIKEIPRGTPYETLTFDGLETCKHSWDLPIEIDYKVICSKCNAKRAYRYQTEGMKAIERGLALQKGFAVLDEMGLGKTIQALGYIKFLPADRLPVLFVVKSGLKYQFLTEILRILGPSYFPQIIKTGKDHVFPGLKTYIIGYDMLRNFDLSKFKKVGVKLAILDEVQLIKNVDSARTRGVRELVRDFPNVLPLSGTPWKNHGDELFPMLNILDSKKFSSHVNFLNTWVDYVEVNGKYKMAGIRNIKAFKEYTKDLLIRREVVQVMPEMPSISRTKQYCEIPDVEQNAYDNAVDEFVLWFNQAIIGGESVNEGAIIAKLQRMRHIIGMAKIPFTLEWVKDFIDETDRKLLIGIHHIDVGNILAEHLQAYITTNELPIDLLRITSDMNSLARNDAQKHFNRLDRRTIMIASTLAAGEGLNLQTASDVFMHERQWNPQNEEQFEGRVRRIGQLANKITANYVLAHNSVDEKLDLIVDRKRIWFASVMNHSFESSDKMEGYCKICGKLEADHNVHWDGSSIMMELAESLVKERGNRGNRKTA